MDAVTIQSILEGGKIGEMPFSRWLGQAFMGPLNEPGYMLKTMPNNLSEMGVIAVRWELGDSNPDPQRLWQAYLVITLPEPSASPAPSRMSPYSLKLVHDIAVEICGSYFYFLRGQELWIEYLVARPEVRDAIEAAMEAGKIGELPFPMWFRYHPASTSLKLIAGILAAYGVASVRWERDEFRAKWGDWQAYLVATLTLSSSVSPPSLRSDRLLHKLVMKIPAHGFYTTEVTETGVELWVSFTMSLPLEEPPGELIIEDGISYISYATPKARRARARARRRALWQALVSFVRRTK
jgi:hypothetical protein